MYCIMHIVGHYIDAHGQTKNGDFAVLPLGMPREWTKQEGRARFSECENAKELPNND